MAPLLIPRQPAFSGLLCRIARAQTPRTPTITTLNQLRTFSDGAPPPLLHALKTDLKTAMRARDQPRLSAIRGVLATATNMDKMDKPIQTDAQLVAVIQKQLRAMGDAAAEFKAAGREDLVEKEEATMGHLKEYVEKSGVEMMGGEELEGVVRGVVEGVKKEGAVGGEAQGVVMKRLLGPEGVLNGKTVDKSEVPKMVKKLLAEA